MGPALFKKQKGETLYSFRAVPVGGYCALEGETSNETNSVRSLSNLPVLKKIIVICAGAIMNILLAFLFTSFILIQKSQFASTTISKFSENAASYSQGLRINDRIIKINGYKIITFNDISFALATSKSDIVNITVIRGNTALNFESIKFNTVGVPSKRDKILIRDFFVKPINKNFISFLKQTFKEIFSNIRLVYHSFWLLLTGQLGFSHISGPLGIVNSVQTVAKKGLEVGILEAINNVFLIMALISVNLGVVNLLPIPALDGGRLLFLLLEVILKKPVNPKIEENIHRIGFFLLILAIGIVTLKDFYKLF